MTIKARCPKGAMIQEFHGGHEMITSADGLTGTSHYGAIGELKNCFCNAVCDALARDKCQIINKK